MSGGSTAAPGGSEHPRRRLGRAGLGDFFHFSPLPSCLGQGSGDGSLGGPQKRGCTPPSHEAKGMRREDASARNCGSGPEGGI